MVFNLIGPPAVGKSTTAIRLAHQLQNLTYLTIDEFRETTSSEEEAWSALLENSIKKTKSHLLLESSGASGELSKIVLPALSQHNKILSINFTACLDDIYHRLVTRHKIVTPDHIKAWNELMFAEYCLPFLANITTDLIINTSQLSQEESYQAALDFLLRHCWMTGRITGELLRAPK